MMSEMYDALRAIDVPDAQARQCAEAIRLDQLATRSDLAHTEMMLRTEITELRQEIHADKAELRQEIHAAKTELHQEIHASASAMRADLGRLEAKLDALREVLAVSRIQIAITYATVLLLSALVTGIVVQHFVR